MARRLIGLTFVLVLAACSLARPNQAGSLAPSPPKSASPESATLPGTVWVNAGLGINLRSAPDVSSTSLEVLRQGAAADVLGEQKATDGSRWYGVRSVDGREGWVNAAYVVVSAIYRFGSTSEGWSLMLPTGFSTQLVPSPSPGFTEARTPGSTTTPFMRVQTAATMDSLPSATPTQAVLDHTRLIEVWSYTALERIYRTPGGMYLTVVRVPASNRAYQFVFWTADNDSALVNQVLASVSLT